MNKNYKSDKDKTQKLQRLRNKILLHAIRQNGSKAIYKIHHLYFQDLKPV